MSQDIIKKEENGADPEVMEVRFYSEKERDLLALKERIQKLEKQLAVASPEAVGGLEKDLHLAMEAFKAMEGPTLDI